MIQSAAAITDQGQEDEFILNSFNVMMTSSDCDEWNSENEILNIDVLHQRPRATLSLPRLSLLRSTCPEKKRSFL